MQTYRILEMYQAIRINWCMTTNLWDKNVTKQKKKEGNP